MKVKEEDYEDIYDCIVTGQVPVDVNIFKTKVFTNIIRRDQNEKNKCSYF